MGGRPVIDLVDFRRQLAAERRRRRRWRSVLAWAGIVALCAGAAYAGYVRDRNAARGAAAHVGGAR